MEIKLANTNKTMQTLNDEKAMMARQRRRELARLALETPKLPRKIEENIVEKPVKSKNKIPKVKRISNKIVTKFKETLENIKEERDRYNNLNRHHISLRNRRKR